MTNERKHSIWLAMMKEREVCVIFNIKKQSTFSTKLEKKELMMSQENDVIHRL